MRFIIMHKTNAHWEAGAIPSPELIARVGTLLGELAKAGVLLGAEGLRASSEGVRLRFVGRHAHRHQRSFPRGQRAGRRLQHPARARRWRTRSSGPRARPSVLGDVEIDIRPVTEPWDIGMVRSRRTSSTRRYMVLRKATALDGGWRGAVFRPAGGARATRRRDHAQRRAPRRPKRCVPAGEAGVTRTPATASACSTGLSSRPRN